MLAELRVENLAIFESAELALGPSFTVLTGETGAGKSLLVDAIELGLGARSDSDVVRSGAPRALVALTFDLSDRSDLAKQCEELGFPLEDGLLHVQREVFAEGRSTARLQGRLTPAGTLREIGRLLVDLHGQHDHQSLLQPEGHLGFLDHWIGEPAHSLLAEVSDRFAEVQKAERRLAALQSGGREREQQGDLLRFQIQEIEAVAPRVGELDELEAAAAKLRHAEKLEEAASEALELLARGEGAASERAGAALARLEEASALDAELSPAASQLRDALYGIEEIAAALRSYVDEVESDPGRLEQVAERMDALKRLCRKYGGDEAAVLEFLAKAKEDLEALSEDSAGEEEWNTRLTEARTAHVSSCGKLSRIRKEKCSELAERLREELRELSMPNARIEAKLGAKPPDASGAEAMEFLFSANLGEPLRPLARIASGGEISRVMLALKTVLAGKAGVPTLIFDEVETGLGGKAASVVGRKLQALGRHYQVLAVSHLPQIAGCADAHFRIEKAPSAGRLVTRALPLDADGRVEEIARMLAGERIGDTAIVHARELLRAGSKR